MINKAKELAKEYNIFKTLRIDFSLKLDKYKNKAVLISNEGEVLYEYQKENLIPLLVGDYFGDMGKSKVIKTELLKYY